jgi:hypothetical protein
MRETLKTARINKKQQKSTNRHNTKAKTTQTAQETFF